MERRTTSFKLRPDIVKRFHAKRKARKQTACEVIETFMQAYADGLVYVAENKLYTIANIKFEPHYYGKPRSKYKRKADNVNVIEYGDAYHCSECGKKPDYVIVSRPSEKEKVLTYYCRYHFDIERREKLQSFGRVGFLEL